jgi:hypothetical protein
MACTLALVILGIFALCAVEGISCPSGMASKKEKKGAKWEVAHSLCMYRRCDTHTQKKNDNSREKSKRGDMLTAAPSPPQMQL